MTSIATPPRTSSPAEAPNKASPSPASTPSGPRTPPPPYDEKNGGAWLGSFFKNPVSNQLSQHGALLQAVKVINEKVEEVKAASGETSKSWWNKFLNGEGPVVEDVKVVVKESKGDEIKDQPVVNEFKKRESDSASLAKPQAISSAMQTNFKSDTPSVPKPKGAPTTTASNNTTKKPPLLSLPLSLLQTITPAPAPAPALIVSKVAEQKKTTTADGLPIPKGSVVDRRLNPTPQQPSSTITNLASSLTTSAALLTLRAASKSLQTIENLAGSVGTATAPLTGSKTALCTLRDEVIHRAVGVAGEVAVGVQKAMAAETAKVPTGEQREEKKKGGLLNLVGWVGSATKAFGVEERVENLRLRAKGAYDAASHSATARVLAHALLANNHLPASTDALVKSTSEDRTSIAPAPVTGASLDAFKNFWIFPGPNVVHPPSISFAHTLTTAETIYELGCASKIISSLRPEVLESFPMLGSGWGAIIATAVCFGLDLEKVKELVEHVGAQSEGKILGGVGVWQATLRKELERLIPEEDKWGTKQKMVNVRGEDKDADRLFVSVTLFPSMTNELLHGFKTKRELVDALVATLSVPGFCSDLPSVRLPNNTTSVAFSGGLSNRVPLYDGLTITVSAVPGEGNIGPYAPSNAYNAKIGFAVLPDRAEVHAGSISPGLNGDGGKVDAVDVAGRMVEDGKRDADGWLKMLWKSGRVSFLAFKF
ncbi:hypothetical protein HDV05_000020 [Chytridiales sp. JEL 0842]|nr:hypothetical protein HDV05_000020 [Chytridiales sp. JEL 0842]